MTAEESDFLTVPQIAALLQVSETFVKRAIMNGTLSAYKVGERRWRVTKDSYRTWVADGAKTAPPKPPKPAKGTKGTKEPTE